jgi:hypothetical protein
MPGLTLCDCRLMYLPVPGDGISWMGDVAANSAGGGVGVLLFSSLVFNDFFRRWRQKRMSERITISTTRPPTTPPAIAPTFVFFESPVLEGFAVPVGSVRVAARAPNVGTRSK